jgi:FixJ family two-component response regulator
VDLNDLLRASEQELSALAGDRALAAQFAARRPGTRVLFMSGYPAASIGRHQMLERGLAFLQKPFSAAALAPKVREVLG